MKQLAHEVLIESVYNSTELAFMVLDLIDGFIAYDDIFLKTVAKLE